MAYPHMLYKSTGRTRIVASQAEADTLLGTWGESPAAFGVQTAPSVAQTALLSTSPAKAAVAAPLFVALAPNALALTADGYTPQDDPAASFSTQVLVAGGVIDHDPGR